MKASKSTPYLDTSTEKGKERAHSPDSDPGYVIEDHREGHGIYVNGLRNDTTSSDYLTSGARKSSASSSAGSADSSALNTTSSTDASYSDGRGITEWAPLHEHSAKWEHTVNVVVKMDVDRETLDLMHNELKLTVMQKVVPGDPNSPENPRRGIVYLNLAEYADAGAVTRRYLLRQSKTNATLKV